MSTVDHTPARKGEPERPQIGVRALLSAGEHRPQVALSVPGLERQLRLSAEEAAELAGRLISMVHMARYDAAVYAALGASPVAPDVHEALLLVLITAREEIMAQQRRGDEEDGCTWRRRGEQ